MRQNPHVRICGGPGSATTLVYPTFPDVALHVGGLSHPLLKFSGGSGDDYATIPDDSSSPS